MEEVEVLGEPAKVVRDAGKYKLVETKGAFWILVEGMAVVGLAKHEYSKEEAIEEFEDFMRV